MFTKDLNATDSPILGTSDVAKLLSVHPKTVAAWIKLGRGPQPYRPWRRNYRFRPSDVKKFLRECEIEV